MMNKSTFGRYMPGDFLTHRLDPRAKLLTGFYFIGTIFLVNNWKTHLALVAFTLFSAFLLKVGLKFFTRGIRPLIWLTFLTAALQVLFTSGGETYWSWGVFHITELGVMSGLFIFYRFVLTIFMSTLLMLTILPLELSDVIEYLFRPLRVVRFSVHEISLMLSIAFRFVLTLMGETEKIMNTQRARGIGSGGGDLVQKMKAVIPLLVPLFISSFNQAEDPATAMEAGGYKGGEGRAKYRVLHWRDKDTVVIIALIPLTALLIFLRG